MSGVANGDGSGLPEQYMGLPTVGWYGTGLGGSDSPDKASVTHGAVVGTPQVSSVLVSSQLPVLRVPVTAGDSSGMSDDLAVHQSALIPAFCDTTGIGGGSYGHAHGLAEP